MERVKLGQNDGVWLGAARRSARLKLMSRGKKRSRRNRRESKRTRTIKLGVLGVVGLAVLALALVALQGHPIEPSSARPQTYIPVTPDPSPTPSADPTVAASMALLDDAARPWTLQVLGDSTGNGPDEWVYLTARRISAKYHRPVLIHNWSVASNTYVDATTVGTGSNGRITIWNGSAPGKGTDYAMANFDAMAPAQPDLVIVSHGHNLIPPTAAKSVAALLRHVEKAWSTPPAFAITLQNPQTRPAPGIATQDAVVAALRFAFSARTLIDVHDAFPTKDLGKIIGPDGVHPNSAGETIWSNVVCKALGI